MSFTSFALGEYQVIASLGRGGMADVFLAVRRGPVGFTKLVVVKRLRADLSEQESTRYRELLLDEARLAARLHHPNIVQTFEVGEHDGQPFIAMEYLDGQPLHRVVLAANRSLAPLATGLALRVVAEVLAGLHYAHELADYDGRPLGIVHRDVSPQNVFWTYEGEIKLVDFGVAKASLGTDTEVGVIKGKASYMAPEQARGAPLDRRVDVFAAGIVLWELVAGRRLFRADTTAQSLQKLLFEPVPELDSVRPDVDPAICRICATALQRDPDLRYATAAEMRAAIEQALSEKAARRDELAAYLQSTFRSERTESSAQVSAAMERIRQSDGEAVSLRSLRIPSGWPASEPTPTPTPSPPRLADSLSAPQHATRRSEPSGISPARVS